jgi:hypothetical protein
MGLCEAGILTPQMRCRFLECGFAACPKLDPMIRKSLKFYWILCKNEIQNGQPHVMGEKFRRPKGNQHKRGCVSLFVKIILNVGCIVHFRLSTGQARAFLSR